MYITDVVTSFYLHPPRFGVTEDQIMNKIMNSNYREMIKFQIARARAYFAKAEDGIRMLSPDARLPVRASLDMYRKILDSIEENDYDNFRKVGGTLASVFL